MKKTLSILAAALVAGSTILVAVPASAATSSPFCAGSDASYAIGSVVDELDKAGASVLSAENWNGCVRAIYSIDGHTSMVFFDPDTLQVVGGTMPKADA